MSLEPNRMLVQYRLVEKIGAGGMGEVYRARDTKLGRDVAIKIVPVEMSGDPERVARFEREAEVMRRAEHQIVFLQPFKGLQNNIC